LALELKQSDSSITGKSKLANGTESPVVDGTASDRKANFTVKRERDGRMLLAQYKATLPGDTEDKFTGQVVTNWGGEGRTFDFEAQRIR
jgi:hypothetical protein